METSGNETCLEIAKQKRTDVPDLLNSLEMLTKYIWVRHQNEASVVSVEVF